MASSTVDLILGKIVSFLENEASLLSGVRDEIIEIKLELSSIRSFLEDADKAAGVHSSEAKNEWVANVRDMACEIEDVLREFSYIMSKQQQWGSNKYTSFFRKGIHFPQNLFLRHQTADKLQKINKKLTNIHNRNKRYEVNPLEGKDERTEGMLGNYGPNWLKNESESSLFLKDDDLVGIEKTQRELLDWLTNGELQRTVISVVGMGGSGKTTLAANTFKKEIVKQHFDCSAWITVSQQYAVEELLRSMIKEMYQKTNEKNLVNLNPMTYRDLGEILEEHLRTRRYLIVLDDVWSITLWQQISRLLPDGRNGSRVMITTRIFDVASFQFGIQSHVLELKPLRDDVAWVLFCMKAFPSNRGQCPPYLDSLARNLAEKCKGLPLAIVALGGLLSCKISIDEWKTVHDNLTWELSNNHELGAVKHISLLSYYHLPYRLKQCFLYCCIFPEDYKIERNRLIRLWVAEGFVEPDQGVTPEKVAERYLMELICRGLLQVAERNASGRPRKCMMHDILRELAVSISKTEKFVTITDGKEAIPEEGGIRRWSIVTKDKEMRAGKDIALLHSLFVFAIGGISKSHFNKLPYGFKLLEVLDLEGAPIDELPDSLVNFFNLRYLNLARTRLKELPKSIGKLCNLQTLLLRKTQIEELPLGIVRLKNLRHLVVYRSGDRDSDYDCWLSVRVPSSISRMKSLQVLNFVKVEDTVVKELGKMTQLKRLCIANVKEANEKDLCHSIGNLSLLRYLLVMTSNEEERLRMDALVSPPPHLEKLYLAGKLEKVPRWFNCLHNLCNLRLHWSRLREDFLPHIQALPNLGRMTLVNAYEGEQLCFLEGFQKLKELRILNCPQLKEILISKGVMPGLQRLEISECQNLEKLPRGWESLPDLENVWLMDVSSEIIEKICGAAAMGRQGIDLRRVRGEESEFEWTYSTF